ncbi:nucleotidyltransferase domain-containing protein [Kribbella sp. NBC_01505]|uniref:nucleotidyltransferase domain-containing protein n=1 Tax=Kribbella sp. NBC_01505 TaxID=2903580 RepID=UPI0038699B9D
MSTVIPTLDGPVLAVLARTSQPLTGRRVHQLAEVGSESGTRRVLTRLAETGLVTATRIGPVLQYVLNREHLAAAAVLELSMLRGRLISRLKDAIEHWEEPVIHASVFGSAARGDGDLDSDIDLLVVHGSAEESEGLADEIAALGERVRGWTGNYLQTYAISADELANHLRAGDPMVNKWLRDCITVYGSDFRRLRTEVSRDVMDE